MSPKSVLVTGCSRGIGLGFVKRFLDLENPPQHIFATYRNPDNSKELLEIAKTNPSVHAVKIDVEDFEKYSSILKEVEAVVKDEGLNLLINNAGVLSRSSLEEVTADEMAQVYKINTIAPVLMTQTMLPLLRRAAASSSDPGLSCSKAAVINVSSKVGSCDDNKSGRLYAYRASKAALNVATVSLSVDLKDSGILAAVVHPGYVVTDMTGQQGLTTVEDSVRGMVDVMLGLNEKTTGSFHDFKHCVIPW